MYLCRWFGLWALAVTAAQANPFEIQNRLYQEMGNKSVRELSLFANPSYQEAREWKAWGTDSFLRHEWFVMAPSTGDRLDRSIELMLNQLVLYRFPLGDRSAIYGENYTLTRWHSSGRFLSLANAGEKLGGETKTVIGFEQRVGKSIRLRLPLFWQILYFAEVANAADPSFRQGIWVAPQIAIQTGPGSEILFTISTPSIVDAGMVYWTPSNFLKTTWHHLVFRTLL